MKKIEIKSVDDLLHFVPPRISIIFKPVYRGQANHKWPLIPSFYRQELEVYDNSIENVIPNYSLVETMMLNQFHQKGISLLTKYKVKHQLDLMVVAQHHGLPTRLLDWTESPLIALFFAVENLENKDDGCIYEYMPTSLSTYDDIASDANFKSDSDFSFISPRHINERVKAQGGYFTLHPLYKKVDVKPLDILIKNNGAENNLTKAIIPGSSKEKIKQELDRLNINRFTIYPDLDGLAAKLKQDFNELPLLVKGKQYVAEE